MMKFFKKKMLFFPACAITLLACIFILFMASPDVYAADYSTGNGDFKLNDDNSVTATFTVSDNNLDMKGWLLCLFSSDPGVSAKSKLSNSNDAHPYSYGKCAHYYFVSSTKKTGTINLTWAANSADQKSAWNQNGGTSTSSTRSRCKSVKDS